MVPLDRIEPDPDQPREDVGDLTLLVASIRSRGVLEPILARPVPRDPGEDGVDEGPRYRIISGERRYRASCAAGLKEIPLIEMDVGTEVAMEIALIENLQRSDLTPFEEARGLRALAGRPGYTHERIASAVGRSRVSVTESISLLRMPVAVRETALALGVTSKSLLLEVMKLDTETSMIRLLERIADHGMTRAQVRAELRRRQQLAEADRAGSGPDPDDGPGEGAALSAKPHVFRFRSADQRFSVSLSFRQEVVEEADLVNALEQLLAELRRDGGRARPSG